MASAGGPWLFRSQWRRAAVVRIPVTVVAAAIIGLFVHDRHGYLLAFAGIGALSLTSTSLASGLLARRAHPTERPIWQAWFVGIVLSWSLGLLLALTELTGHEEWQDLAPVAVPLTSLPYVVAHHRVFRARSGDRRALLDVTEAAIAILLVLAPVVPLVVEALGSSANRPWTTASAQAALLCLASSCSLAMIVLRTEPGKRGVEGVGLAASAATAASASTQIWMGASDFAAPASIGLALHALSLGVVALVPLHVTAEHKTGLDRLAPEEQIRTGAAVSRWALLALPVLVAELVLLRDRLPWIDAYAVVVLMLVAALGAVRHEQTTKENRRLYGVVAAAAAERRRLVADVMRSMEHERHRLAGALHEQAASAYAVLVTFIAATGPSNSSSDGASNHSAGDAGAPGGDHRRHVADALQNDLRQQAESLRHLSLALQPLEGTTGDRSDLAAPIAGCVDSLYGDHAPALTVAVHPDLHLDWTTRVLVFRIVEEALRNIWRHAEANEIEVTIDPDRRGLKLCITDDGVGFDPSSTLFESGLDSMRNLAALGGGRLTIDAERGEGTMVVVRELGTVRLGGAPYPDPGSGRRDTPSLRMIHGDLADGA